MKTLNEQIERLKELIRKCYGAVVAKNGTVPEVGERNMENLPSAIASTHDTLEELTITENGEYTPQEGVDGFSKVVANVVPSRKVVIPSNMQVRDELIIDGYWAGELVDTSKVTSMYIMFSGCSQLQSLDVSNWDTSEVSNMRGMFENCSQLQSLNVSNWDTSKVGNMRTMFNGCSQLQSLDVSNWDTSEVSNMYYLFAKNSNLEILDLTKWDLSSIQNVLYNDASGLFINCSKLKSIIGGKTIEYVLDNNISALCGYNGNGNIQLPSTILDRASLRAVINGLADLTGQTPQTLTLGATLIAKLTEEDIAIATNKNWTIV